MDRRRRAAPHAARTATRMSASSPAFRSPGIAAPEPRPAVPVSDSRAGSRLRRYIESLGGMTGLGLRTLVTIVSPPFPWWREFLRQSVQVLKVTMIPIAIAVPAYAFGAPGIQGGGGLATLGSAERDGGFIVIGVIREFGVFVTCSMVAGIYGTMTTAELGARKVRDELDALRVMAVSPITFLVAPRVLALTAMMMVLNMYMLVCGTLGGFAASVGLFGATPRGFFTTFFLNTSWLDLVAAEIKIALLGFLIGVICCYKGLSATGGAEGVGRAVNEAVVSCLIAIFFVNLVFTQFFLALYPQVEVLR
jgi:phospholipid/cholesterol/gamma-HCH transport system permease protein